MLKRDEDSPATPAAAPHETKSRLSLCEKPLALTKAQIPFPQLTVSLLISPLTVSYLSLRNASYGNFSFFQINVRNWEKTKHLLKLVPSCMFWWHITLRPPVVYQHQWLLHCESWGLPCQQEILRRSRRKRRRRKIKRYHTHTQTHRPPPTENITPIAFAMRVLSLATLGIWNRKMNTAMREQQYTIVHVQSKHFKAFYSLALLVQSIFSLLL